MMHTKAGAVTTVSCGVPRGGYLVEGMIIQSIATSPNIYGAMLVCPQQRS